MSRYGTQDTSAGTANFKKRRREDSDSDENEETSVRRPAKLSKLQQRENQLRETAQELKKDLLIVQELIDQFSLRDIGIVEGLIGDCDEICSGAERRTSALDVLNEPFKPVDQDEVLSKVHPKMQKQYIHDINEVQGTLQKVATLYGELLKADSSAPSPSTYALPTVWPVWQAKPTGILNLRPSDNQGLPISTLHIDFARFRAALKQPLPKTVDTSIAHHVAFDLCTKMANSFQDERDRRDEFEDCIKPLFEEYDFQYEVVVKSKREACPSKADLLVRLNGRPVLGVQSKLESGDAYTQVSRVYQTWVNQRMDRNAIELPNGAPMFLICLIGPLLIVAGGFFDGKHVIVEPLAEPCLMLPDYHHDRQERLMRVLLALKEALESLARLDYKARVSFAPATPRVYPNFTFEGQSRNLTFKSRLLFRTEGPDRELLFLTNDSDSRQYLVKLVPGDRYGIEAHRKIAEAGFAPTLFDVVRVEGAHTAYIMEYLSPADGWTTLHKYMEDKQDVISHISAPLEQLLDVMKAHNIAHGDLRPNNIMIRRAQGARSFELKVIDFDWAGESGTVKYPWRRNETIDWPAKPDDFILTGHDRTLLMSYLIPKS